MSNFPTTTERRRKDEIGVISLHEPRGLGCPTVASCFSELSRLYDGITCTRPGAST